jgi:hypothetical protein
LLPANFPLAPSEGGPQARRVRAVPNDDFSFLDEQFEPHLIGDRTGSTAMLAWFLEHVLLEEPEEVEDALCDGSNDKGVDAVVINADAREITVFQGKRRRNAERRQGDSDLQQFRGIAPYFRGPDGIDDLLAASPNEELRKLVERHQLREILDDEDPWSVSLVFVTNAELDPAATAYLTTTRDELPPLTVWHREQIAAVARRTERPGLLSGEYTLVPESDVIVEPLEGDVEMAIALVPANELVRLPGIPDLTLFALNVRLGLGRTKINRELAGTIKNEQGDHALFPAYHNGITILTSELSADDDGLHLDGITVVNGCQSLLALHANRASLTPDLTLLVKAVQLSDSATLADTITYRSNNQNAVNIRDQRANDPIQRDLQRQVTEHFGDRLFYVIRRGEQPPPDVEVLENQDAAQHIMAIWLREPWSAVRKLKLFDDDYRRIFGRAIDAPKLYVAHRIKQMTEERRSDLRPSLSVSFASVRFTIVYLTAAVARESELGAAFFDDPGRWLPEDEEEVFEQLAELMDHVITELNSYAQVREEAREQDQTAALFDAKIAFKNQTSVRQMEQHTLSITKALARRIDDFLFSVESTR